MRDFPGFEETSRKLLMLKPGIMQHWVTLSAACFTNRNYTGCLQAVESIIKFSAEEKKNRLKPFEMNEIVLLALQAYEKQGKYQEALEFYT